MKAKDIAEKYIHGHHDNLTDADEKKEMIKDIRENANYQCRELLFTLKACQVIQSDKVYLHYLNLYLPKNKD